MGFMANEFDRNCLESILDSQTLVLKMEPKARIRNVKSIVLALTSFDSLQFIASIIHSNRPWTSSYWTAKSSFFF